MQPLDYTTAILTVWAIVWGVVAIWIAVGSLRDRRRAVPAGEAAPTAHRDAGADRIGSDRYRAATMTGTDVDVSAVTVRYRRRRRHR